MFCSLKRAKCTFFFKKIEEKFGNSEKSSTFARAFRGMRLSNRKNCGNSSVGRAQTCDGWGSGVESRGPRIIIGKNIKLYLGYIIDGNILGEVAELVDALL